MPNVKYLVLHHTAGSKADTMEQERQLHLNEGFKEIAYNGFIEWNGTFKVGRDPNSDKWDQNGANHGLNSKSLSIACAGNFENYEPSEVQLKTLVQVLAAWCKKYSVPVENIIGHYEVKNISGDPSDATLCPGKYFKPKIPKLRQLVKKYL